MNNSRSQSISSVFTCACLFWLGLSCVDLAFTQEPLPSVAQSETSLLLMKSGRMVSGEISESAGGYLVKNPTGSMVVPFESVLFEAKDLHEIYLK
ncbi:MAG TPA: hypothetical protein DDZ90_15685 [Planctomycetaceae bacterium]|nr:hypothetical protein [Planctomycetaceae bacterium]